ncbi:MAG: DNA-directed RNA polymerase subunit omega [Eubacteriales bacterium]|nr:DNA-directed RNA polymerase subunit omega [Eubacteriales bacterium]
MAINKPTIKELSEKVDSRYALCIAVAKRSRQLVENDSQPLVDAEDLKPIKVAAEEINRGLVSVRTNSNEDETKL